MIKLLILSYPVWNERNNSVNTYINLFGDVNKYEVANVATIPGSPNGTVCKRYFLVTEEMIINHFLKGEIVGKEIFPKEESNVTGKTKESGLRRWAKKNRFQLLFWAREMVWKLGGWKSKSLEDFVKDYNPDVVVLPVKASRFFNRLGQYVHKVAGKPLVCFVTDDVYTYHTFSLSPLVWIDRMMRRSAIRKSILSCDILYTLTEKQKKEYDRLFGIDSHVVTKGGDFSQPISIKEKNCSPLRLIYTGNLGAGRWHTLALIGDALVGQDAELQVYTGTQLKGRQQKRLLSSGKVKMMGLIPQAKVKEVQKEGDILVHVESFDLSERYSARLSFSTKIVDYFESARCILAVGWRNTAAIEYLQEKDAAYVITDEKDIANRVHALLCDKKLINKYANNAYDCGKAYHNRKIINDRIFEELKTLL